MFLQIMQNLHSKSRLPASLDNKFPWLSFVSRTQLNLRLKQEFACDIYMHDILRLSPFPFCSYVYLHLILIQKYEQNFSFSVNTRRRFNDVADVL